jgi:hypothetical protein
MTEGVLDIGSGIIDSGGTVDVDGGSLFAGSISGSGDYAISLDGTIEVGGSVTGSPGEVRLWFSEAIEQHFSGAEVTGPSGRVGGSTSVSGNQLVIAVPHLAPGSYRVDWHVISVDTHKMEGSFTFAVK